MATPRNTRDLLEPSTNVCPWWFSFPRLNLNPLNLLRRALPPPDTSLPPGGRHSVQQPDSTSDTGRWLGEHFIDIADRFDNTKVPYWKCLVCGSKTPIKESGSAGNVQIQKLSRCDQCYSKNIILVKRGNLGRTIAEILGSDQHEGPIIRGSHTKKNQEVRRPKERQKSEFPAPGHSIPRGAQSPRTTRSGRVAKESQREAPDYDELYGAEPPYAFPRPTAAPPALNKRKADDGDTKTTTRAPKRAKISRPASAPPRITQKRRRDPDSPPRVLAKEETEALAKGYWESYETRASQKAVAETLGRSDTSYTGATTRGRSKTAAIEAPSAGPPTHTRSTSRTSSQTPTTRGRSRTPITQKSSGGPWTRGRSNTPVSQAASDGPSTRARSKTPATSSAAATFRGRSKTFTTREPSDIVKCRGRSKTPASQAPSKAHTKRGPSSSRAVALSPVAEEKSDTETGSEVKKGKKHTRAPSLPPQPKRRRKDDDEDEPPSKGGPARSTRSQVVGSAKKHEKPAGTKASATKSAGTTETPSKNKTKTTAKTNAELKPATTTSNASPSKQTTKAVKISTKSKAKATALAPATKNETALKSLLKPKPAGVKKSSPKKKGSASSTRSRNAPSRKSTVEHATMKAELKLEMMPKTTKSMKTAMTCQAKTQTPAAKKTTISKSPSKPKAAGVKKSRLEKNHSTMLTRAKTKLAQQLIVQEPKEALEDNITNLRPLWKITTAEKNGRKHARFDLNNLEHLAPGTSAKSTPTSGIFLGRARTKRIAPARKFAGPTRHQPSADHGRNELSVNDYVKHKKQVKTEKVRTARESAPSPEPSPPLGTKQLGARPLDSLVARRTRSAGQPLTAAVSSKKKSKKSAVKKNTLLSSSSTKRNRAIKPAAKRPRKRSFSNAIYKPREDSDVSSAEPSPVPRGQPKRKPKDHPDARFTISKKDLQNQETTPPPTPKRRSQPPKKTPSTRTDTMSKTTSLRGGSVSKELKPITCAEEIKFMRRPQRETASAEGTSVARTADSQSAKRARNPLKSKLTGFKKKADLKKKMVVAKVYKASKAKASDANFRKASNAESSASKVSKDSKVIAPAKPIIRKGSTTKPKTRRTTHTSQHVSKQDTPASFQFNLWSSEKPSEKSTKPAQALLPPPKAVVNPAIAHWTRRMRWHVENDELWRDLHGH